MARLRRQERHGFGDDGSEPVQLRGRPTYRLIEWLRPRLVVGFVTLALLGLLLFSIVGFVGAVSTLPYRAGWAGVPGTASLVVCTAAGEQQDVICYATFADDDGGHAVEHAVIEGNTLVDVHDYPARLHPDGTTISLVTRSDVLYLLAELCSLVVGIVLSAGFLAIGGHATVRRWLGRVGPMPYRRQLRAIAVTCGVGAAASIALYLVARALVG